VTNNIGTSKLLINFVLTEDVKSFTDFVLQGSGTLQKVEEFSVVHLQEHTGDLTSKLGLKLLNLGEQVFSDHLLFLFFGSGKKGLDVHFSGLGRDLRNHYGLLARLLRHGRLLGLLSHGRLLLLLLRMGLLVPGVTRLSVLSGSTTLVHGDELIVHVRPHVHHVGSRLVGSPLTTHHVRRIHHSALLGYTLVEHGSTLRRVELRLRVSHLAAGSVLGFELSTTLILTLSKGNVKGLALEHVSIHLSDGLGGFLRGGEADESESLALSGTVLLDVGAGDRAKFGEFLTDTVLIDFISQVLDVKVDTSILLLALDTELLELLTEFLFALGLLLGTANVKFVSIHIKSVHLGDGGSGGFGGLEVQETEPTRFAISINGDRAASDSTELFEHFFEISISGLGRQVLDVDVGENAFDDTSTVLLGLEGGDADSLLGDVLAVDTVDSLEGSLVTLVVHETISKGLTLAAGGDLA